jgi:hypothetical protein
MTSEESLVGRDLLFAINEPYEIAANIGEPPRRGRGVRVTRFGDGTPILWIRLEVPIDVEGTAVLEIGFQARHVGMSLVDVLKGDWLMANASAPLKDSGLHFFATLQLRDAEVGHRR